MTAAEDQSSQEEEEDQPEPHRPGSEGEFISLEQARRIAVAHARENQDFYGRRYGRHDLTWHVVSQEERAEGYHIRLSYRPLREFRGRAGVEDFTIDRQGSVQSRRIVSQPVRRGRLPGCGSLAAGVLLTVLVLVVGMVASAM